MTEALTIACHGERLAGVLHRPRVPASTGVVVLVGGPQYRVGSHRQFVQLARALATAGYPVLRFDFRGMGDSDGIFPGFEAVDDDVSAAIAALKESVPGLEGVVLWGLCDAATAAAFYAGGAQRPALPVLGLVLANPWVRTEQGLARSYVRNYYGRRLADPDFWKGLLKGRVNPFAAAGGLLSDLRKAVFGTPGGEVAATSEPLPDRLRAALDRYRGPVQFVLSGEDLTAREFESCLVSSAWDGLRGSPRVTRLDLPAADHTFARPAWTDAVSAGTIQWLSDLPLLRAARAR